MSSPSSTLNFSGFFSQLAARSQVANSLLCVGLDPQPDRFADIAALERFCFDLIDRTAPFACAFKPNAAFFEAWGAPGQEALQRIIGHVPPEIPVILDAKRGDIASTSTAYAQAAFNVLNVGAITVSPYLGRDGITPFVKHPGRGVFVLVKTSNPSASELQDQIVDGMALYEVVARRAITWGSADQIGLVVGATDSEALRRVRKAAPSHWFLVPGVGAQAGDLNAAVSAGLRADGSGVLINVSRAVADSVDPTAEAQQFRDAINAAREQATVAVKIAVPSLITPSEPHMLSAVAEALAVSGCIKFGRFTLKSGLTSPFYVDLRRLVSYPEQLRQIGQALADVLRGLSFDHIAAIPYAALPIGTAAALILNRSLIYPRREAKTYGTGASIEGVYHAGDRVVLVDDLATTGETKFETIARLRAAGLIVEDIVVVIDRQQGAAKTLSAAGYRFHAVAAVGDLLPLWQNQGFLDAEQRAEIAAYLLESTPGT